MSAPFLELLIPLREAIVANSEIVENIAEYLDQPAVFTKRPMEDDNNVEYPFIVVGPMAARTEEDGVGYFRPVAIVDISVYGTQPNQYRVVEEVGEMLYGLFHRQRESIEVEGYSVIDIRATGPIPAPTSDANFMGRNVNLTIRLSAR